VLRTGGKGAIFLVPAVRGAAERAATVIVTPFVALTHEVRERQADTGVRVALLSEMTLQDTEDSVRVFDVDIAAAEQVATGKKCKNLMSKFVSAGECE
jgi:superfamily II DNA helicase RecQ